MKKFNLSRRVLACVVALTMIFGAFTTAFAALPSADEAEAFVNGVIVDVKAEVNEVIDIAKNGSDEEKRAKVDEYINNIKAALVENGVAEADIDNAVERIEEELFVVVAIAMISETPEELVDAYVEYVKSFFNLSAEEDAFVDGIIEEVEKEAGEIAEIVINKDDAAAVDKVGAYATFLKGVFGITAEDEAKAAEIIADTAAMIEKIQQVSVEDIEAVIDAYIADLMYKAENANANLGHQHYEADENSYYLALGADTLYGAGIVDELVEGTAKRYADLVKDELDVDGSAAYQKRLNITEASDFVASNAAEIAKADLITYQLDASAFVNALLSEAEVDWTKYIDAETSEALNIAMEKTTEIITRDWAAHADAEIDAVLTAVLPEVQAAVVEALDFADDYYAVDVDDEKIDSIITLGVSAVKGAFDAVNAEKDEKYAAVAEAIDGIDQIVKDYAEKLAYVVVSFAAETVKSVETIQAINPDAALLVLGMYNPLNGLEIVVDGDAINIGEYFEYAIDVTNAFYYTYAAINGGYGFVDVSKAATKGFATSVEIEDLEAIAVTLVGILRDADASMHANKEGLEYIKDQIIEALTCNYCEYAQLDETYHYILCAMCKDAKIEKHVFDGDVCTLCGYKVPTVVVPEDPKPNPRPNRGGGGSSSATEFTVKFETNGAAPIASVKVKKGELLAAPADPVKEGYAFGGWYTDKALKTKYNFSTPVTKSFTLYAKWVEDVLGSFKDLDKNAWYYEYVYEAVKLGLMNGVSDTEFAPNATLTRGMFVTILHRVEKEANAEGAVAFTDVADDAWYAAAVKWASANGIVNGVTETEFAPNAEVTREQMATIMARFAAVKGLVVPEGEVSYTDGDNVADYAKEAVAAANKLGLLIGNADGSFAPKNGATRAEAATLFVRLVGTLNK